MAVKHGLAPRFLSRDRSGKVRTESIDGFLVESGPDSFIIYRPAALELARDLGLGDAIIRPTHPRTVWIRSRGRFVQLPEGMGIALPTRLGPFIATDMFSPLEKLRILLDVVLPRDGLDRDVSVGAFLRRRLGARPVDRLAGPLLRVFIGSRSPGALAGSDAELVALVVAGEGRGSAPG